MSKKHNILHQSIVNFMKVLPVLLFMSLVINLLQLATPMYSLQVMDKVISSQSLETLGILTVIMLVFIVMGSVLSQMRDSVIAKIDKIISTTLLPETLSQSVEASPLYKGTNVVENTMNNFKALQGLLVSQMTTILDAPFAVIFLITLFLMHPLLGMVTLIGGVVLVFLAFLSKILSIKHQRQSMTYSNLCEREIAPFKDSSGAVEANGMAKNVIKKHNEIKALAEDSKLAGAKISAFFSQMQNMVRTFIQIATTCAAGYLIVQNEVSMGAMIASSILSGKALAPCAKINTILEVISKARGGYVKLKKIIKEEEEFKPIQVKEFKEEIALQRVVFFYPSIKKPTIKGVDLTVKAGEIVGLLGENMTGKSTILKMIAGIYKPSSGMVKIDGVNLEGIDKTSFGSLVGYLPQPSEMKLTGKTIKDCIARMNSEIIDDAVTKVCQMVGVHKLILQLEGGYNTAIVDNGTNLSYTVVRKIALARCLVVAPKILILDDIASEGEHEGHFLKPILKRFSKNGVTIIMTTQSSGLMEVCDKFYTVKNGLIK